MRKKMTLPLILLMILTLLAATAHATDLEQMSLEELQKLQEQLNQAIAEKQNQAEPPEEPLPEPEPEPEPEPAVITALKIAAPEEPLASGSEIQLAPLVTVTPAEASKAGLEYTVNDENIASVTPDKTLAGKKAGAVTVTVTDPVSGKKAAVKIQVITKIQDMDVTPRVAEVFIGKSVKLEVTITPEDATNKKITWESEAPEIARVAANGTVTGVAPGKTYIHGYAQDGSFQSVVALVTVTVPMRRITLKMREKNYFTGDIISTEFTIEPENTTNQAIEWVSSDPSIAEVNSYGQVSAKSPGKCTITGTARDGSGATAKFTAYVDPVRPMHIEMLSYKDTKAGRMISLDCVSDCVRRKIEGFNYELRCYDAGDDIPTVSTYYFDRRLDPGKKAATKYTGSNIPGMDTASRVVVIVTGVFFTDGTSVRIPEDQRHHMSFNMN